VEDEHLSCAVLDHALRDGDSTELCRRLTERGIPFVIYSGWGNLEGPCAAGEFVRKPASTDALIAKVEAALPPDSASA
jgi:FixJ family two-component response regulator